MNNQFFNSNGAEIEIEAFHPGEFLLEEIEYRQIQKKDFAKQIGIYPNNLSLIFAGKRDISAHLAIKLGKALGTSGELWYNMQSAFNFQKAMQEECKNA
ncbi:HigA family addiction module antitoxin [Sphingobacterium hotanense]|uniref:HigA family addiction module antitoxin n=1 Tax=Sphingobacterium hotanense TaxID=649196 RepID=UPI0011F2C3D9|nr:HigA family addiction module antitoxin [Sphingobacterium hotanense]